MDGQIVKIISNDYFVSYENEIIVCKSRGKFRNMGITPKVGDYVIFDKEQKLITDVLPSKNNLDRPNVANIDQSFIVTSLKKPGFSTNLLDKLLVVSITNNIKPVILLTKKDLLTNSEFKELKPVIKYYKEIGFKVIFNNQKFKIKRQFKNKITVFTGQTGSGKSTMMNKLDKRLNFETNEISKALGRGKHTTRYITLVELFNGKVLDTPGFSSIDLSALTNEQIRDCFIEFSNYPCPFKNCMHINEKDCHVIKKVKEGKILDSRYENYKKFIEKR